MSDIWEPAGGHVAWEHRARAARRALAEEHGYDATIRPWSGGWEISGIKGPGIENGATQACTIDEVQDMVRDYVDCTVDLGGEGNDEWEPGAIPVRLTLDLELDHHTGTKTLSVEAVFGGEPTVLVEQITWWREAPGAE